MAARPQMPPPPDMIAVIGEPPEPRSWPTEEESGWQMKIEARRAIDAGEIKTVDEALARFKSRVAWIASMRGTVALKTAEVWIRMEQQFMRSALKYFRELQHIKETFD